VTVYGQRESALTLDAGDCAVVLRSRWHVVGDDAGTAVTHIVAPTGCDFLRDPPRVAINGGGASTVLLSGLFFFPGGRPSLVDALPEAIRIPGRSGRSPDWLSPILALLSDEIDSPSPGSMAVRGRLGGILLLQMLRRHIVEFASQKGLPVAALGEPRLARVLHLMHVQPGEAWSVRRLAREAAMSRSAFSARFRRLVGMPPMSYLHALRMRRARDLLRHTDHNLRWVAEWVGYGSEAAFSNAYRQWSGTAPGSDRHG
jgi:AraC-like DNA-binding protein